MRLSIASVVVGIGSSTAGLAQADGSAPNLPAPGAPSNEPAQDEAVDEATTPLPARTQIAFKPAYTFPNGADRYTAELLFQPIMPYRGLLIPDLDVPGVWSIARVQLAATSLQNRQGTASGLGDLTLTDLAVSHVGPFFNVGAGFATVFPMATTPALGQGKWQLGPAVGFSITRIPQLRIAALVQNFYSIAGNSQSPALAYVTLQPFITLRLPADLFLQSDAQMTFNWRGGSSTVPINLGLGRAFSEHFVGALQFWYTVADSGQGDIRVRAVLDFQP